MALTRTTLSGAIGINDTVLRVASATGFTKGELLRVDDEMMMTTEVSGTNISVLRGQNASVNKAHAVSAGVVTGTAEEFAGSAITVISYPLAGRQERIVSYSAAGAIAVPSPGTNEVAVINGTGALAMTLAVPTTDKDGDLLTVASNGSAAHTLTLATAIGNGGSGYTVLTFPAGGQVAAVLMALNGIWVAWPSPYAGTVTNIDLSIS